MKSLLCGEEMFVKKSNFLKMDVEFHHYLLKYIISLLNENMICSRLNNR